MRNGWSVLALVGALAAAAWAGPDLVVNPTKLASSVGVELQTFATDACELRAPDLCVGAPGGRKVVRFSVFAENQGDADLVVGDPMQNPNELLPNGELKWVFSQCHNHFHFQTFARYELRRRGELTAVLTGQKRSFCIEDTLVAGAVLPNPFCCNPGPQCPSPVQGIHHGFGDLYPSALPCQWIDVTDGPTPGTDLAAGDYDLCVLLNTGGFLDERPLDNNTACVPFTVDPPARPAPRVKLQKPRARAVVKVGSVLKVTWKKKLRGKFQQQEVWWSKDGGVTWTLLATTAHRGGVYPWTVPADAVTEAGVVRVVVWQRYPKDGTTAGAYQRGVANSGLFRVTP